MSAATGLKLGYLVAAACLASGCSNERGAAEERMGGQAPAVGSTLFTKMPSTLTGIRFVNRLEDTQEMNVFTYRNFYNGGGVGIGDLTGDGLPEVYLTSNLKGNKLYLNRGAFRFQDVTDDAGVKGKGFWATGVTLADVNGDGRLDIYVCYAGNVAGERRANELYINDGPGPDSIPRFSERAKEHGLADEGYSTHAAFFDYDRDGDLDMYLVNNSFRPVGSFGLRNIRNVRNKLGGHKLYRNDGGRFSDVSEKAGIYGSEIAFGLGLAVGDVNRDGWPDIYVSNDFFERDYLYINNHDGTFAERLEEEMPYISYSSMGLDMADINNDSWPDIYVTDMLPEDDYRLKTMTSFEGWNNYQAKLRNDYHHQFTRNMLHLNNADGTFSEIGQMAGVARTDWSWSALLADLDLDGYKDAFVTNGIARDVTSQDYIAFLANDATRAEAARANKVNFLELTKTMSSTKLPDYAFRNRGDLTFSNESARWGLNEPSFSNGAAYGDLDGDGALDLVVNNINQEAFVFRNNARTLSKNRYLQVRLEGEGGNRFGVGAKVTVRKGELAFTQEEMPSRGFQSSVDYLLTFGVGAFDKVDSVTVEWPDGRMSAVREVGTNQRITVRQLEAASGAPAVAARPTLFTDVTDKSRLAFVHRENAFVDFDREPLIPKMLSTEGPLMSVADVNGDGLDDLFIGGAKGQAGALFAQQRDGRFLSTNAELFAADKESEDLGSVFFDANGDGYLDLYVVSGGNEFSEGASPLQDRLYFNGGRGVFRKAAGSLPIESNSGECVAAGDFDGDGDIDLFVGGRVVPGRYGIDPPSVLLKNDGRGRFTDVTASAAPALASAGMISGAVWIDVDRDRMLDLVVVGDWMPLTIFRNTGGKLEPMGVRGLEKSGGWWNRIVAGDFNGDGRVDFIAGNLGLNTRLQASAKEPTTMYVKDFAGNGFLQQIISYYTNGVSYPLTLRDDLIKSLTFLKSRYPNYKDYARQTVNDIFPGEELSTATLKEAHTFATSFVRNDGNGAFTVVPLPLEAQMSPVYGILPSDFDGDGRTDLLLAGNFDGVKPEIGRMAAGYGLYLEGDGRGSFTPVRSDESGFLVPGEARDIKRVRTATGDLYVVSRNNAHPLIFRRTGALKSPAARSGGGKK